MHLSELPEVWIAIAIFGIMCIKLIFNHLPPKRKDGDWI